MLPVKSSIYIYMTEQQKNIKQYVTWVSEQFSSVANRLYLEYVCGVRWLVVCKSVSCDSYWCQLLLSLFYTWNGSISWWKPWWSHDQSFAQQRMIKSVPCMTLIGGDYCPTFAILGWSWESCLWISSHMYSIGLRLAWLCRHGHCCLAIYRLLSEKAMVLHCL